MCCIFTCCGWMVDLIQRAWVFFMSCCISSAVCCVLLTSSMSGVALGYNYSLAEFVDLKETNVSVYLKRGIFDDEISDEAEWRRRGGGPIKGHVREDDLITGPPEDSDFLPERSGRRLDDSILQSDNRNQFEGSLMKLTANAPYQTTVSTTVTNDRRMEEIVANYPAGSPDQLKAIQGLINMRKAAAVRDANVKYVSTYRYDESMLVHAPDFVTRDANYRRQFGIGPDQIINPQNRDIERLVAARKAVPESGVGQIVNWLVPKLSPEVFNKGDLDYDEKRHYPKPIPLDRGSIRPTRPAMNSPTHTPKAADVVIKPIEPVKHKNKPIDVGMDKFKENIVADTFELPRPRRPNPAEQIKTEQDGWKKTEVEYYDEDVKGLPVRKKRSVNAIKAQLVTELRDANSKGQNVKITNNSNKDNEITHYPSSAFLNKLLSSNKALSNELSFHNEGEESSKTNDNLKESMKKVVKIIRSMFS